MRGHTFNFASSVMATEPGSVALPDIEDIEASELAGNRCCRACCRLEDEGVNLPHIAHHFPVSCKALKDQAELQAPFYKLYYKAHNSAQDDETTSRYFSI